jgi:outer membrane protein OmpA-like peptidoglycan-associated protein
MKAKLASALILSAALTGCTTADPYTGEQTVNNTTKGAAIGAAAGAAVAAVANPGAAVGGGIGYYMDRQEAALRAQLQNTGVSVQRDGDNLILVMPGNVTFATDSADLRVDFVSVLDSVVLVLEEFNRTYVEVSGHTDNTGSDAYNQTLSERRAETVASYMLQKNILPDRILVYGYGESRPIATNNSAEGRQANRRVEIQLVPVQG